MTRLRDEDRTAALAAWESRRARHEPEIVNQPVDNSQLRAGSPMFFTCLACYGPVILAEDYLTSQAICYDCRDLADAGWIVPQENGAWVRA